MTIGQAAAAQYAEEIADAAIKEPDDLGDPHHPGKNASDADIKAYINSITAYSDEMLNCLAHHGFYGEELWIQFTCTFRSITINFLPNLQAVSWTKHLRANGVFVEQKRGLSRNKALVDCLFVPDFIPFTQENENVVAELQEEITSRKESEDPESYDPTYTKDPGMTPEIRSVVTAPLTNTKTLPSPTETGRPNTRSSSVNSPMRAYANQPKFSGLFTDDFEASIEQYETLCSLCEVRGDQRAKAFPVMLTGSAFSHYNRSYGKSNLSY